MGLFICQTCGKEHFHEHKECLREDIDAHVARLQQKVWDAEREQHAMRNTILMLISELPSLEGDTINVSTKWLRRLWEKTDMQWYDTRLPDIFLKQWIALHRTLTDVSALFRSVPNHNTTRPDTIIGKLAQLKEQCLAARKELGYDSRSLDLSPEDVIERGKNGS